jgi:hypothetical protein
MESTSKPQFATRFPTMLSHWLGAASAGADIVRQASAPMSAAGRPEESKKLIAKTHFGGN